MPKLIVVLAALLLLGACSKKQSSPSPRPETKAPSTSGAAKPTPSAGTIRLTPVQREGTPAPSPARTNVSAASGLRGNDRLMAMRGTIDIFPSDYEIGALQPAVPAGTERGKILQTIHSFFGGLAQGKVDTSVLSPQWKEELVRSLSYPRSKSEFPSSVRIGVLKIEGNKAQAAIRMEKGKGRASGEIYLERVDGTWYISDIQADFSRLGVPFVRAQEFDPAEWKSLMKE